jgi:hypothetical protein
MDRILCSAGGNPAQIRSSSKSITAQFRSLAPAETFYRIRGGASPSQTAQFFSQEDGPVSHPFDATLKDILGHSPADLTPVLHLPEHLPARTLNVDLSTVSAATDVAFGFGDPLEGIVDVNSQSGPDTHVDARLLSYSAAYHLNYPVPVRSILILLRPAADLARSWLTRPGAVG